MAKMKFRICNERRALSEKVYGLHGLVLMLFEVPLGTVSTRRVGHDVTILANMLMFHRALEAASELETEGISAEVIDMRCLVPLDLDTIVKSVTKTGRFVFVEEEN